MTEFLDWLADAADRRAARGLTRRLHTTKPGDLLDLATVGCAELTLLQQAALEATPRERRA